MAFPYPIVGPIALYTNLPIHAEFYQPSRFVIEDIALGQTTTITTTEDMNYVIGQQVRLLIPESFGSYQLNGQTGFVISIPDVDQVVLDIDSSLNVNAYIASSATTQAQIIPIGDVNSGQINSSGRVNNGTYIPGSFINISP